MTKDEIKQLIAAKIAGQGSAVDAASALPTILNEIIDSIPEVSPAPTPAEIMSALTLVSTQTSMANFEGKTKAEAAELMGVMENELDKLFNGDYLRFSCNNERTFTVTYFSQTVVVYGYTDGDYAYEGVVQREAGEYSLYISEI